MRKLSRWFRKPGEKKERAIRETVAEAEKRLAEMLKSENSEVMAAIRRMQDAGLV